MQLFELRFKNVIELSNQKAYNLCKESLAMEIITSTKNEKIKNISALLKSKKARDEQGVFVIEGVRILNDTIKTASEYIEGIYASEALQNNKSNILSEYTLISDFLSNNTNTFIIKDSVFESISGTVTTQGIMAIVRKPTQTLADLLSNNISSNKTKSAHICRVYFELHGIEKRNAY